MAQPKISWSVRIGRTLSGALGLFFVSNGLTKLIQPPFILEACLHLGFEPAVVFGVGAVLIACTILYLVPRTSILGAILMTGYFGGALAGHVRVGDGPVPIVLVFTFGVLTWTGLYLRDPRVRALFGAQRDRRGPA